MTVPASPGAFPSLIISRDGLEPRGSFAEAQATYLRPNPELVKELDALLEQKKIGVVAHFYMDPELQGVLSACSWPHIQISDSLVMADRAARMASESVRSIVVLGVDFMSENVRAMLDASGHRNVGVYRVASDPIGCSLAESAEAKAYGAYLTRASQTPQSLHVVYINTSLRTKAKAHALVPTITCTSSNVVQTVLTAFAQIEGLHVWFGPDTYMGRNLESLFRSLAGMSDDEIRQVHPKHDVSSLQSLLARFHYFEQGTCVVHHMFGEEVVARVRRDYSDGLVAAHLEVPGEMFALGMEGQRCDRGVVGSTSNILSFITRKVQEASGRDHAERLQFILGTEAGMITSIVRSVQKVLAPGTEAEIVFPVASTAIAQTDDTELGIVPGVASGEGCSTAGGCATCPFMKMNSLDALFDLVRQIDEVDRDRLRPYEPKPYTEQIHGRTVADLGGEPILHMRAFQRTGQLPDSLVDHIVAGVASSLP